MAELPVRRSEDTGGDSISASPRPFAPKGRPNVARGGAKRNPWIRAANPTPPRQGRTRAGHAFVHPCRGGTFPGPANQGLRFAPPLAKLAGPFGAGTSPLFANCNRMSSLLIRDGEQHHHGVLTRNPQVAPPSDRNLFPPRDKDFDSG